MQSDILIESRRKYDLLNGRQMKSYNGEQEDGSGEKLLEMARKKYELLHGIQNFTPPQPNSEEEKEEDICGRPYVI